MAKDIDYNVEEEKNEQTSAKSRDKEIYYVAFYDSHTRQVKIIPVMVNSIFGTQMLMFGIKSPRRLRAFADIRSI